MGKNKEQENKEPKAKKEPGFKPKMACSRCQAIVGVRKEVYDKRVEKYGSEDRMLKNYICLNCKRELSGLPRKDDIKPRASKNDVENFLAAKKKAKKSKKEESD